MPGKIKYQLEFPVKASPKMLYHYLTKPSGLSEWFSDDVNFRGRKYVFIWEDSQEEAEVISSKLNTYIKLRWLETDDDTFFEFRIEIDDLTKDVSLIVTDFAEEDELEENKLLWETQIRSLLHTIGS